MKIILFLFLLSVDALASTEPDSSELQHVQKLLVYLPNGGIYLGVPQLTAKEQALVDQINGLRSDFNQIAQRLEEEEKHGALRLAVTNLGRFDYVPKVLGPAIVLLFLGGLGGFDAVCAPNEKVYRPVLLSLASGTFLSVPMEWLCRNLDPLFIKPIIMSLPAASPDISESAQEEAQESFRTRHERGLWISNGAMMIFSSLFALLTYGFQDDCPSVGGYKYLDMPVLLVVLICTYSWQEWVKSLIYGNPREMLSSSENNL